MQKRVPALVMLACLGTGSAARAQRHAGVHAGAQGHTTCAGAAAMSAADAGAGRAALERYDRGDAAGARPVLARLAEAYPCDTKFQAAAGMASAEAGETAGAIAFLRRAHAQDRKDAAVSFNLGVAELKAGDAGRAAALFQELVKQQPGRAEVHLALAQAEMQAQQYGAAAEAYARAAELERRSGEAATLDLRMDWALALMRAGQPAKAKAVLLEAPGTERSAPAQELIAEAEEKSGNYAEAAKRFQTAAQLDPSETMMFSFGNELLQHWTFGPAIDIFKFGLSRYPESERMQMALGIAYFGNGNYDHAATQFEAMLLHSPGNDTAAELLGRSCASLGGITLSSCNTLQTFAEAHPANASASLYAASAILKQPSDSRDTAKAESLLQNALRVNPQMADGWYELGVLQQTRSQWEASATSLEHAVSLRAAYPEAHYRLSRAYAHMGRRDRVDQEIALQQKYAQETKQENGRRMQDVITFLTARN